MKLRLITFIAATMTALYAFAQHGEGKSNITQLTSKDTLQSYKNMRLVWSDEFNGNKLDTISWNRCERAKKQWSGHMSPADTVCRISNGTLKLYGIRTPPELNDTLPCITGGINSKGKRSIRFGRVDVRARIEGGKGFWPAIWLIPDSNIAWPRGGEIDIMEHLNHEPEIHQTVHT